MRPAFFVARGCPVCDDKPPRISRTGQHCPGRPGQDMSDDQRAGVPIAEAAEQLGVTIGLLRKRAQRGTMPAYKVDGRWFVVLDTTEPIVQPNSSGQDVQDVPSRTGQNTETPPPPRSVSPAAMSQLEAIRDEWLQPLIDQNGELQRRLGRTEEQRDAAIREAERERIARQRVDQKLEEANAELELLREIHTHQAQEPEPVTEAVEASPTVAGEEMSIAMNPSTLQEPSRVRGFARRLFGRS